MTDLRSIYPLLSRHWTAAELAGRLAAASRRGDQDLSPEDRSDRPIAYLATAVPRLVSLAVAVNAIHLFPSTSATHGTTPLSARLLDTVDRSSAGGLRRCQLALELDAASGGYESDEFLASAGDLAGELLTRASPDSESRSIAAHAQEAGRWVAIAIDLLDRDEHAAGAEAIADCLGRLLVVCVFADAACGRLSAPASSR